LLACFVCYAAVLTDVALFCLAALRAPHVSGRVFLGGLSFPFSSTLSLGLWGAALNWQHRVMAVNLPGLLPELLFGFCFGDKSVVAPRVLPMPLWRTISYPLYCIPAWSFVGAALDAARRQRHLRRWEPWLGLVLSLAGVALSLGLCFGISAAERSADPQFVLLSFGAAFWAALFAIPFALWLRERRKPKA
jgi:hypothetical protein